MKALQKPNSVRSLVLVAASLLHHAVATAQVVVTPNQIVGTIEFSNSNPDVLAILNSSLPMVQVSLEATSIGAPPVRQAFGNSNTPDPASKRNLLAITPAANDFSDFFKIALRRSDSVAEPASVPGGLSPIPPAEKSQ